MEAVHSDGDVEVLFPTVRKKKVEGKGAHVRLISSRILPYRALSSPNFFFFTTRAFLSHLPLLPLLLLYLAVGTENLHI